MEAREAESDEPPEAKSEIVRALATRLSDGSTLVVGDERHRSDAILRGVLSAFGWAVPFAFEELMARLNALARRPTLGASPTVLKAGDLELDLVARTVRRGGEDIDLQPREFRLLEFLVRSEGRVVTRKMLLEQVWEFHFDPKTNIVETHISRLRTKIDRGRGVVADPDRARRRIHVACPESGCLERPAFGWRRSISRCSRPRRWRSAPSSISLAATLALGTLGGLWLSAQFLGRIDSMRLTAQRLMAGDWSRRIPLSPVDDDLTALARTFNRLFDRIEKLLIANKQVSADIAHDLRKPLASMLRRLEGARDDDASPESVTAAIEAAISEIEGVLDTFNALLRIGQVEAGARRAAFRPLDLAEVAREVVEAFQPAAEEEGKTLLARLDAPLPMAGDNELLVQMIANLLDNALRHTPQGAGVEVSGKRTPGGVSLTVADDGAGVAPDELKSIFQRFYRAEAARASTGTGLGLSLVAAIADLHGLECAASDNRP